MSAGYSGTPLVRKLGIKQGHSVLALGAPPGYRNLLEGLPDDVRLRRAASVREWRASGVEPDRSEAAPDSGATFDVVHIFTTETAVLAEALPELRRAIFPAGAIWSSWPKKASRVETDLSEDVVRRLAFANGLVDVKVCAVDEVWSGLKLVIPLRDRPGKANR